MYRLFLFFSLIIALSFKAQTVEPLTFSEVVKVDSISTSQQLYSSAKVWFTKVFQNPKYVIKLDDPVTKTLMGTGSLNFVSKSGSGSSGRSGSVSFDISVICKDGRYKYEFSNFIHKGNIVDFGLITNVKHFPELKGLLGGNESYKTRVTQELQKFVTDNATELALSLKKAMNKPSEDW